MNKKDDLFVSRARPMFLYVMYCLIALSIPFSVLHAVNPQLFGPISVGFKLWFEAIPDQLYWLFGTGYIGYAGARTFDKMKSGKTRMED